MTPKPRPPHLAGLHVAEFSDALGEALRDAYHEFIGDAQVLHFWDDDSLHDPVRGIAANDEGRERLQSQHDQLVQSLFSAGMLGTVSLLRPHLTEFLGQVSVWEDLRRPASPSARWKDLVQSGRGMKVIALAEALEGSDLDSAETLELLLGRLRSLDFDEFIQIESLAGTWQHRLKRLLERGLIDLSFYGPSLERMRATPEYERISSELNRRRGGKRPLATAIDAAAIASLITMKDSGGRLSPPVYPRFFTSSSSLRFLYASDPWLRDRLSYDIPGSSRRGTVWRNSNYYFLRAILPELRLNSAGSSGTDRARVSQALLELSDLHERLEVALTEGRRVEGLLHTKLLDGEALVDRLEDLQRSRMSRVWTTFRASDLPANLLRDLSALFSIARDERTLVATNQHVENLEDELIGQIDDYKLRTAVADAVDGKVKIPSIAGETDELTISDHLGGVRWGYMPHGPDDIIPLGPYGISTKELERISNAVGADRPASELLRTVAVLLGVDEFDLANEVLDRARIPDMPLSMWLMSLVAIIEGRRSLPERELQFYADSVKSTWADLSSDDRAMFALGFGHAMFSIWSRSAEGGAWRSTGPLDTYGWAEWSIDVVEQNWQRMSAVGQLFAVNHILYVRSIARRPSALADELVADFERISALRDDFRFLDTSGVALMERYRRDMAAGIIDRDLLQRAGAYLRRARELAPNDPEIARNVQAWEDLSERLT